MSIREGVQYSRLLMVTEIDWPDVKPIATCLWVLHNALHRDEFRMLHRKGKYGPWRTSMELARNAMIIGGRELDYL